MTTQHTIEHRSRRMLITLSQPYEEALAVYEKLVPAIDPADFVRAGSWSEVLEIVKHTAPHGFMRYYTSDIGTAMMGSPSKWRATQYLMGNHTIAERMFRHDPAVMLHAPLRTLVYVGPDGDTTFAVDQPSLQFGSYGDPDIAAVGRELDGLLAALIRLLGGQVPQELIGEAE
ncbi:DUF302 domain-containing protein [Nocardia sp. NPDC004711]